MLVGPQDWDVIGGLSIALKTGGAHALDGRTVKADAALRGSMGTQPSSGNHPAFNRPTDFFSRRPTTRMGVEWEWRKALSLRREWVSKPSCARSAPRPPPP